MDAPATPAPRAQTEPSGLPQAARSLPAINYYPPVVATLLASLLLLAVCITLGLIGVLNTVSVFGRVANNEQGSSILGGGVCGLLTLLALAGAGYFSTAVYKGIRDVRAAPVFTRGTVAEKRQTGGRKASNWLLIEPSYMGSGLAQAAAITDEQQAASVDRSKIVHPRFEPKGQRPGFAPGRSAPTSGLGPDVQVTGGYLSPERISASNTALPPPTEEQGGPKAVFRADFASAAKLETGEEVIVAHSRHLQHIFYIARLRDGEWESIPNKSLI